MPATRLVAPFAAVATTTVSASIFTPGDRDSRDECDHKIRQLLLFFLFGLGWVSFIERLFLMNLKGRLGVELEQSPQKAPLPQKKTALIPERGFFTRLN